MLRYNFLKIYKQLQMMYLYNYPIINFTHKSPLIL